MCARVAIGTEDRATHTFARRITDVVAGALVAIITGHIDHVQDHFVEAIAGRHFAAVGRARVEIVAVFQKSRLTHARFARVVLCALVAIFARVAVIHGSERAANFAVADVVRTRIRVIARICFALAYANIAGVVLGAKASVITRRVGELSALTALLLHALIACADIAVVTRNFSTFANAIVALVVVGAGRAIIALGVGRNVEVLATADGITRIRCTRIFVITVHGRAGRTDLVVAALVALGADVAVLAGGQNRSRFKHTLVQTRVAPRGETRRRFGRAGLVRVGVALDDVFAGSSINGNIRLTRTRVRGRTVHGDIGIF